MGFALVIWGRGLPHAPPALTFGKVLLQALGKGEVFLGVSEFRLHSSAQ